MNELFIDVATNYLYVGLKMNNETDCEIRIGKNDNAAYLVDKIDILLKRNEIKIDNINTIIVGVGPGSYTGIRVAVTVAKMLAYTKNIELKKISSLLFLSSGYKALITASIDARRGYSYILKHDSGKTIIPDSYIKTNEIIGSHIMLNKDNFNIDLSVVSKYANPVSDVHGLEPNYLRKTQAETNYDNKNK